MWKEKAIELIKRKGKRDQQRKSETLQYGQNNETDRKRWWSGKTSQRQRRKNSKWAEHFQEILNYKPSSNVSEVPS